MITQQRKKPAVRAFSGLTGRPMDEPVTPVTAPVPSAKPGRRRKYADNAAKQDAYRDRLSTKKQDSERRAMIAKVLKRFRASLPFSKLKFGDQIHQENRRRLAQLHAELKLVALANLNEYLETLEAGHDQSGRMWGERSGEAKRTRGQSEIERIIAARSYDVSLGEVTRQDPLLAGGFKVRPHGAAPDEFETDAATHARVNYVEPPASEKRLEKAVQRIIDQIFMTGGRCLFCDEVFTVKLAAERHLYDMHGRAKEEERKWSKHMSAVVHFSAQTSMGSDLYTPKAETVATHHQRLIEQEARRRKLGNIVTERFESKESSQATDTQTVSGSQPE